MNDTVSPEQVNPNPTHEGPGRRLAEARKARGLSLEEIAAQLRLSVSTVQALENDDRSRLPPATFVSGYLRSYARIVGISEHELVQVAATSEPPIVGVASNTKQQVRADDPSVRLVTYAIVIGLLAVSGGWWLVSQDTPTEAPAPQEAAVPAPAPETAAPLQEAPTDAAATAAMPDAATEPPADAALTAQPVGSAPAAATPSTPETAPTVAAPPAKPVPPPPPALTANMPQSKLRLEFSQDCWVSVTDKAGRQLAYKTFPAGQAVTLRGEAPFKVFFGNSAGAQVFFNGQAFDHKPFQRNETARFRLGTVDDNGPLTEAN